MSVKSWRPWWTNPGASTQSAAKLDDIVNRDLLVKRNALVKGNLTLLGKFNWGMTSFQTYNPNVIGYVTAGGGGTLATGIITSGPGVPPPTGRWRRFDTMVFFEFFVSIIGPRSQSWNSNLYVDLPVKPNAQFVAGGTWKVPPPTGTGGDNVWYPLFAVAKANATQIVVIPTVNSPTTTVLLSATAPPMDITVSGTYEAAP